MQVQSLGWEDPLKEGMAIHSNILVWRRSLVGGSPQHSKELPRHPPHPLEVGSASWTGRPRLDPADRTASALGEDFFFQL